MFSDAASVLASNVEILKKNFNDTSEIKHDETISNKNWLLCLLFVWFLGMFGVHNFYVGKIGMGFLYLCTFSLFGIGYIVDFVLILCMKFRDAKGRHVKLKI